MVAPGDILECRTVTRWEPPPQRHERTDTSGSGGHGESRSPLDSSATRRTERTAAAAAQRAIPASTAVVFLVATQAQPLSTRHSGAHTHTLSVFWKGDCVCQSVS
jgi:hypothetical protein